MLYKSVILSMAIVGQRWSAAASLLEYLEPTQFFYRQLLCEPSLIQSYHSIVISFGGSFWGRTCRVRLTGHSDTVNEWQSWGWNPAHCSFYHSIQWIIALWVESSVLEGRIERCSHSVISPEKLRTFPKVTLLVNR